MKRLSVVSSFHLNSQIVIILASGSFYHLFSAFSKMTRKAVMKKKVAKEAASSTQRFGTVAFY